MSIDYAVFDPDLLRRARARKAERLQEIEAKKPKPKPPKPRPLIPNPSIFPEYGIWRKMIRRCDVPKDAAYKDYGGRGIRVCDRWRNFDKFMIDMGRRPTDVHQLDRINNDGDYSPGNCRWATAEEQANNRRSSVYIQVNGEQRTMAEWARHLGVAYNALRMRIRRAGSKEAGVVSVIENPPKRQEWRN